MNTLFIVSGVSGSGKTTLMKQLMNNELISHTTRPKRKGECEGNPYYFISEEVFDKMLSNGEFVEYSYYYGHGKYGITYKEVENKLKRGNAYVISDYNGFKQFKKAYPQCVSIFIYVDKEDARKHMEMRGDSAEMIEKRLGTYDVEIENMHEYDHIVVNRHGEIEETIEKLKEVIVGNV